MSYGALSKSAVKTLSQGVAISGGSYMNTGEGGISPYHLSKIFQVIDPKEEYVDNFSEEIVDYIKRYPNCSNFDLEERFGKGINSHLNSLVEDGTLEEKHADLNVN